MIIPVSRIMQFPDFKQRRLDELLDKNSEGTISNMEMEQLKLLVSEAEQLIAANSERAAEVARNSR